MKQYGTAPGQNNYTPDFLQHFDQKDGGKNFKSFERNQNKCYSFLGRVASQAGEGSPPQSASVQQQQLQQQQQQQQQVRESLQPKGWMNFVKHCNPREETVM